MAYSSHYNVVCHRTTCFNAEVTAFGLESAGHIHRVKDKLSRKVENILILDNRLFCMPHVAANRSNRSACYDNTSGVG